MTTRLTEEEKVLAALYGGGSRMELIAELTAMKTYLGQDEDELRELADRVVGKVSRMSDWDFDGLELFSGGEM